MGELVLAAKVTHVPSLMLSEQLEPLKGTRDGPIDSLKTDPATRGFLKEAFFFEPNPSVKRVVFIGTPQQGSSLGRQRAGVLRQLAVDVIDAKAYAFHVKGVYSPAERLALVDHLCRVWPLLLPQERHELLVAGGGRLSFVPCGHSLQFTSTRRHCAAAPPGDCQTALQMKNGPRRSR